MIIVNRKSTCLSVLPANLRKSLYPRCLNPSSSLSTLSNTFSSQYAPFSACRCYRILFHWCFSPNSLHLAELHDVHAGQYFPFIIRLVNFAMFFWKVNKKKVGVPYRHRRLHGHALRDGSSLSRALWILHWASLSTGSAAAFSDGTLELFSFVCEYSSR